MFCATEEYIDRDLCPLPKLRKKRPVLHSTPGMSVRGASRGSRIIRSRSWRAALKVEKEKAKLLLHDAIILLMGLAMRVSGAGICPD